MNPQERIRILKFMPFFYLGGTERQVMNLATGLDARRFDLHLACNGKVGELLGEAEALGVPVTEYPIDSLYNGASLIARARLARYLRAHSIEVVHSYGFYSHLFAIPAAKVAGVPLIIASIRDCGETLTPMQKRAQRMFCQMADCILVNAEGVRRWLVSEGYPPRKIQVIRNGIVAADLASPSRDARPTGSLHQEFGWDESIRLVAVCSRLNRMKGLEYFLEAAATVARRYPDVRFLIVGGNGHRSEGDYLGELQRFARSRGLDNRVIFTGFRTDVARMLPEIAISVLPSLSEGLSNSLLEAMAAGVPVVATRVGGTPELVQDGVTGLLVPARNPAALVAAMASLLDDPGRAKQLGDAAREQIVSRFSIAKMVQDTESLYSHLLNEMRTRAAEREVTAA